MKNLSNKYKKMNSGTKNIFIYFILLLGLFVLIFFTKDYFSEYQTKITNIEDLTFQSEKIEKEINKLVKEEKNLDSDKTLKIGENKVNKKYLKKYIINFTENNFIEYFYSIGKNFEIEKLQINKGKKDKNGFLKGNINLSLSFKNEDEMKGFLSKLISNNNKYNFFIEKFTFPFGKMNNGKKTKIDISMILYYKDKIVLEKNNTK